MNTRHYTFPKLTMRPNLLFSVIVLFVLFADQASASGPLQLDEFNFNKIRNKFHATVVKFDKLFPVGDRQDAFENFAKEMIDNEDVLVAELPVKNYADIANVALARKYEAHEKIFPVVKLFIKGKSEPITFDDAKGFTTDELRRFVQENSGLHVSLPGCIKEFDQLAIKFMRGKKENRIKILQKTEDLLRKSKYSSSGMIYKIIMETILEIGDVFILSELDQMQKLLNEKASEEKRKQLRIKVNILKTFLFAKQA